MMFAVLAKLGIDDEQTRFQVNHTVCAHIPNMLVFVVKQ